MKLFLLLLMSLSLFAFENGVTYQCQSLYRADIELSPEEQAQTIFEMYIKKDGSYLKTSEPRIYDLAKTSNKGRLYASKHKSQGKTVYYKLQFSKGNKLLKFVTVPGYGKIISEYVACIKKK